MLLITKISQVLEMIEISNITFLKLKQSNRFQVQV